MTQDFQMELKTPMGPAMSALSSDQQRRFVIAYCQNGSNAVQACRAAGYHAEKMSGWRLLQRPDIQAAMTEVLEAEIKTLTPLALKSLRDILATPSHKDHGKAVFGVLDRTGFHAKTEHKSVTEYIADDQMAAAVHALAQELGMDTKKLWGKPAPKMIEAKAIVTGREGLEDLL